MFIYQIKPIRPAMLHEQNGFTILELMIVIAIIGIVTAIAAPSIDYALQVQRNKEATQSITSALKEARVESFLRKQEIKVRQDANHIEVYFNLGGTKTIINTYTMPKKINVQAQPVEVTFKPNKQAQAATYTTYCTEDSSKMGRQIVLDANGNIIINTGASKC